MIVHDNHDDDDEGDLMTWRSGRAWSPSPRPASTWLKPLAPSTLKLSKSKRQNVKIFSVTLKHSQIANAIFNTHLKTKYSNHQDLNYGIPWPSASHRSCPWGSQPSPDPCGSPPNHPSPWKRWNDILHLQNDRVFCHLLVISFISFASIPSASARGIWKCNPMNYWPSHFPPIMTIIDHCHHNTNLDICYLDVCVQSIRSPSGDGQSVNISNWFHAQVEPDHLVSYVRSSSVYPCRLHTQQHGIGY